MFKSKARLRVSMIDLLSSYLPRPPEGSASPALASALASSLACLPDLAQACLPALTCMPWLQHSSTPANMVATGSVPEPQPSIQHEPSLAAAPASLAMTREISHDHPKQHAASQQNMSPGVDDAQLEASILRPTATRAFPSEPSLPSQSQPNLDAAAPPPDAALLDADVPIDASADDSSPQLLDAASPAFHLEPSQSLEK